VLLHLIFWILFAFSDKCATEDSTNCAWHAASQGNGYGQDFVRIGDTIIYGTYHNADGTIADNDYSWTIAQIED
jgi:hypothetical protein